MSTFNVVQRRLQPGTECSKASSMTYIRIQLTFAKWSEIKCPDEEGQNAPNYDLQPNTFNHKTTYLQCNVSEQYAAWMNDRRNKRDKRLLPNLTKCTWLRKIYLRDTCTSSDFKWTVIIINTRWCLPNWKGFYVKKQQRNYRHPHPHKMSQSRLNGIYCRLHTS